MDKNIIDNDELSVTAATPNGQAALARFGEMIREGRSTAAIEAFARQLPDHPVQGVSLRWLIGQSVWSMLFFGRDDLESLKNFHHYLNKGVYTQAVNRRKERHAVDTGDWGRLVRHPKRQSAWEPLQTVVFSPAQLRIDSLFLDGTALPEILRVCVGLRKADRAAVFAHSPWVYQFFEPKFLNGCEPSRLRFLRRRLNDMPLPVASACLGMIMDEAGDARDDIRELFESAELDGASEWTIFWHIAMGLSTPILSVLALNTFTAAYGNFMMAFLLCQDQSMWTMMVYLYQLQQNSSQAVGFAALIIAAIPTLLVFIFCQNIIIKGIVVPSEK